MTVKDVYDEMNDMFNRPPTFVLKGNSSAKNVWSEHKLMANLLQKRK